MARGSNGRGNGGALELPLLTLPASHPCSDCGACCRYVATEIDEPTTPADYDHVHWYLTHRDVSVYIDWEGDWYLEFTSRCNHLTNITTCDIYGDRPKICSDFSWDECEQTTKEPGFRLRFTNSDEFFEWSRTKRPRSYARYVAFRKDLIKKRERAARAKSGSRPGRSRARSRGEAQSSTSI
jgi:Fe-S-cluster containining protein